MSTDSYKSAFIKGSVFSVLLRYGLRLIGLFSISITARILTPEDFGFIGFASIMLGLISSLSNIGFDEFLVRPKKLSRTYMHTVWTFRFLIGLSVSLLLFIFSTAWLYFMDTMTVLMSVMQVLALLPVLESLTSPAYALFHRDLKFAKQVQMTLIIKLLSVATTLILTLWLRSYWALALGILSGAVWTILITQLYKPYMPRLTLRAMHKLRLKSAWNVMRNGAIYFSGNADEYIVKSYETTSTFGEYHVSRDLARIFVAETISPIKSVFLAVISKFSDDSDQMRRALLSTFAKSMIVMAPIAAGLSAVAYDLIAVFLGFQWLSATPYLQVIAFMVAFNTLGGLNQSVYISTDRQSYLAVLWLTRSISYFIVSLIGYWLFGLYGLLHLLLCATALFYLYECVSLALRYHVPLGRLFACWTRCFTAAFIMAYALHTLVLPETWHPIIHLTTKVMIGVPLYCLPLAFIVYSGHLLNFIKEPSFEEKLLHSFYSFFKKQ